MAARKLEEWSRALERLEADEAFDDPLVMAELDATGQCLSGIVVAVDSSNREIKPGGKVRSLLPLVKVRLDTPTRLLEGMEVIWAGDRNVVSTVRDVPSTGATGDVTLAVMKGHDKGTNLPGIGSSALFVALTVFSAPAPEDPLEVPWTHRPGDEADPDATLNTDLTYLTASDAEQAALTDGSPDLSPDELLALPAVGLVSPGDVPGVVL